MIKRHVKLYEDVRKIKLTPSNIERGFNKPINEDSWECENVWDKFVDGTKVHLGKRSSGWKFLWNFNNDKYYKDKESLLEFIRSGRIVNEYSEELDVEEFIEMSLSWGEDDGWDLETYYKENPTHRSPYGKPERYVDGLRISDSVDFS
jgi:hypothetical protein